MLNKKEVSELFKVTTRTIENWVKIGLPYYQVGGTIRFEEKPVKEWFKKQSEQKKLVLIKTNKMV